MSNKSIVLPNVISVYLNTKYSFVESHTFTSNYKKIVFIVVCIFWLPPMELVWLSQQGLVKNDKVITVFFNTKEKYVL